MSADTESSGSGAANQALFSEKVRESQEAIQRGDFNSAVTHYTDAIQLDPVSFDKQTQVLFGLTISSRYSLVWQEVAGTPWFDKK